MIDLRKQMTNINVQKHLETHLELQNANMFDNFEEEYDEPDFLKEKNTMEREVIEKENEDSQVKEITSESMDRVRPPLTEAFRPQRVQKLAKSGERRLR